MSDTKNPVASSVTLGFEQVRKELMLMQPAGCYWVTVTREEDAQALARQCISTQPAVTLICPGSPPPHLPVTPTAGGPRAVPLFSPPETHEAVVSLPDDLAKMLTPEPGVILFFTKALLWEKISPAALHAWVKKIQSALTGQQNSLLIITSGPEINPFRHQLQALYRYLNGLAHLDWQPDSWRYRISWWANHHSMLTDRTLRLALNNARFTSIQQDEQTTPLPREDENLYLAEKKVLEGAPPLSSQWILFEDNAGLCNRAQQASAATVVFSLQHNEQIIQLAGYIHGLRRSRGCELKIVVREMQTALRNSDERLLLACGVNVIVPASAPVSRMLTVLEEIQGHAYHRHVPADLAALLRSVQPVQARGYLPQTSFCRAVTLQLNNTLLPENGKGLLIALRTVPGLKPEQALSLCKPRRFGDVVTLTDDRIWLYLSSCRYNDLDTALSFIFRQPQEDMFSDRRVWYEDLQILAAIREHISPTQPPPAKAPEAAESASPSRNAPVDKMPPDKAP